MMNRNCPSQLMKLSDVFFTKMGKNFMTMTVKNHERLLKLCFLSAVLASYGLAYSGPVDGAEPRKEMVNSTTQTENSVEDQASLEGSEVENFSSLIPTGSQISEATSFDYHQMNLIPRKCVVNSRSLCDTSLSLGGHKFKMPIVPANMECVVNPAVATKLAQAGYFYIYHRFSDTLAFADHMKSLSLPISISVGVNEEAYTLINALAEADIFPDYVTVDIAHGHAEKMRDIIGHIKSVFPKCFVIAGNVSTAEATRDLESYGADAIKVGIGPGSACTTYSATGFGSRGAQASIVQLCANACLNPSTAVIADGGITEPGDIAKSLALGARMVMVGGMFSALTDSPGKIVQGADGRVYKEFWGSASSFQSSKTSRIEGTKKLVLMKDHGVLDEMSYLEECLQSAISYGGGRGLECFQEVKFCLRGLGGRI